MTVLPAALILIFAVLGLIHLYWGVGGKWPGTDAHSLVERVVGTRGRAALIVIFGLRGLAPYVTPAFSYARGTPFYTLNIRYYAPLCLVIAAALAIDFPAGINRLIAI